jgi:glycosyltransferase involved in cell wall biosynthesis
MPHVALITNAGWSMAQHRREQIRGLVAAGWRVSALADYRRGEDVEVRELGAQTLHVKCEGSSLSAWQNSFYIAQLTNMLRRLKPDLVHCFSLKATLAGSVAARLAGIKPVVGTVTGQGIMGSLDRQWLKATVLSQAMRHAFPSRGILIFQNQSDQREWCDAGMIDLERTAYIPGCGVDVARLAEHTVARPAAFQFVHASRMLKSKGVAEFVKAARYVKATFPQATFVLYGGCAEDYLSKNPDFITRAWLEELNREGIVLWVGRVTPGIVEQALLEPETAAAVLLSRYAEGVPRFLIEAAACGLPIITTDHPGCGDVVIDGKSGWLCPAAKGEFADAARAMLKLLRDPGLVDVMGRIGRKHAMRFDAERVLDATLVIYERVLRAR